MECQAYGTTLQTNADWPHIESTSTGDEHLSIHVERVRVLPECEPRLNSGRLQGRTVDVLGTAPDIFMRIDDLLLVSFDHRRRRLHCFATMEAGDGTIEYWLLRQIVPIARLLWGEAEILHAGAVKLDGEAAAFLAPSGTGKSTLVAQFVRRGCKLITDDHLILQRHHGRFGEPTLVFPSIPYYRDYRAVETLGQYTDCYDTAPCRLRVIYVLTPADPLQPVRVTCLPNSQAALELLHQAPYSVLNLKIPSMLPLAKRRFEFVSKLPLNVSVRRLDVPRSLDRLPEVEACILSDFRRIGGATDATV